MSKRRVTWLLYNAAMTPFIPMRLALHMVALIGEAAEWVSLRMPGWRRYDGWSYGAKETHL